MKSLKLLVLLVFSMLAFMDATVAKKQLILIGYEQKVPVEKTKKIRQKKIKKRNLKRTIKGTKGVNRQARAEWMSYVYLVGGGILLGLAVLFLVFGLSGGIGASLFFAMAGIFGAGAIALIIIGIVGIVQNL